VRVTDTSTGCFGIQRISIAENIVTPTLSANIIDQSQCAPPNGSITASVNSGNTSDYAFSWYRGNAVKPTPDFPETGNSLSGLTPGVYTVKARHLTNQCETAPRSFTVGNSAPLTNITINNTLTVLPGGCTSPTGALAVDISAPGNTLGFDVAWYVGKAPFTQPPFLTETVATTSATSNTLSPGAYTVEATDRNTGCKAQKEIPLPFSDTHTLDLVSQTDVTSCAPNNTGNITVKLTPSPPSSLFNESNYDIFVYAGTNDPGASGCSIFPPINGVAGVSNYSTPSTLTPGFYTLVAVAKGAVSTAGCRSSPVTVEILQSTTDPVITASPVVPNTSCNALVGNGAITVAASVASTIEWFNGTTVKPTADFTGANYTNLRPGFYTVRATATATQCVSVETFAVSDNPTLITLEPTGLDVDSAPGCDPATGIPLSNGSASITGINENGTPATLATYTFTWTNLSGTILQTGVSPAINGLSAGTYIVKIEKTATSCFTDYEFTIDDITEGTLEIDLVSFQYPERCLNTKDGSLAVVAAATSPFTNNFTFEWYAGSSATGPVVSTADDFQNITVRAGQADVTFTVKAINLPSNCFVTETYILPLQTNPVILSASSSSPITSCIITNGTVFATVINDNSLDYDYQWFIGSAVDSTPDFTGNRVDGLGAGTYTVQAVDKLDNFCTSQPTSLVLEDQRTDPPLTAALTSPVTNCDPQKVNGAASASVNENVTLYTFEWYAGTTATGTPVFSGPTVNSIAEGVYTVLATDRVTGCNASAQVTVTANRLAIEAPTITILSQVTSCVEANGELSASVNGNTEDYIFQWYRGSSVKSSPDYLGETYSNLNVGIYTVTATSRITGCISPPVSEELKLEQVFPDFDFRIIPATCGDANGSTSIFLTVNVPIESIEWEARDGNPNGPNLTEINPGTYTVTVVSQLGCATSKSVTINSDIRPYNGVSRNGDGRNDIFYINCIDQFPKNNVKIFNRAGTMVYESDNYNNIDIYFDGKSNRGVSPLGNNLPDGTYFYIIDKRDGSKPLAGYLELVN